MTRRDTVPGRFSPEWARTLPPDVLRAVIRERTHHLIEEAVQSPHEVREPGRVHGIATVRGLLDVWQERGLPASGDDLAWARTLLDMAESGRRVESNGRSPAHGIEANSVMAFITSRRSIRAWDGRPVPREMLETIVLAGLWAPCACNLQTLRVIIVDDRADRALFKGDVRDAPAYIVVCQDSRPYEPYGAGIPAHNRMLDCGAAMQNMLLMAHALGLGAVWLTFTERQVVAVREHFAVAPHIDIISYIGLGWPTVQPIAPGRMDIAEIIL
jgi:nitroreductase